VPAFSTDPPPVRVTFNPGPSQVPPDVIADIHEIADSGLLTESHRSERVKTVVKGTVAAMRLAMRIPDDHTILFQQAPEWRHMSVPENTDLITVTHNETSTGMAWPRAELRWLRGAHPDRLIAVDVTSSFGALAMDWTVGDIWFGSVQKCLGLPAGLGFAIVGPRAFDWALGHRFATEVSPWQDVVRMTTKIGTGETVETPNVLAIALLGRRMARWDLGAIEAATHRKAAAIAEADLPWSHFVDEAAWRSPTVHCMRVADPAMWRERALSAGFRLGGGYGKLKKTCIRIATFPAHSEADVLDLLTALA